MSETRASARIDLGAIRHNATRLARAAGRAQLIAVVKANGYGHGAAHVAEAALAAGATRLAVATTVEAQTLRDAGINAPLQVMGPLHIAEFALARQLGVEVTIWTPEAATAAIAAGVAVHLKFDTGMGRLGAQRGQVDALVAAATSANVVGLMTHFATADERNGANAGFMNEQLVRFRALLGEIRSGFPGAIAHAANSAATLRSPDATFDAVRCGIALYGCSPFGTDPADDDLRPALTLRSWVASLKDISSQESVGYGRAYRAMRGTTTALIPVGYADGYPRRLGNRAEVLVGGRRVPVVGNISMDQLTIDLGPESNAAIGDEVVLIGPQGDHHIGVEEVAGWLDTISYEVICAIGPRVVREWTG